mmetsp:Transcript_22972/g.60718  ORF Transcript_22972/g.60718 Transcript_22972/m.60718 type:complete len:309 (+) Transcript_22972:3333-4259(+)
MPMARAHRHHLPDPLKRLDRPRGQLLPPVRAVPEHPIQRRAPRVEDARVVEGEAEVRPRGHQEHPPRRDPDHLLRHWKRALVPQAERAALVAPPTEDAALIVHGERVHGAHRRTHNAARVLLVQRRDGHGERLWLVLPEARLASVIPTEREKVAGALALLVHDDRVMCRTPFRQACRELEAAPVEAQAVAKHSSPRLMACSGGFGVVLDLLPLDLLKWVFPQQLGVAAVARGGGQLDGEVVLRRHEKLELLFLLHTPFTGLVVELGLDLLQHPLLQLTRRAGQGLHRASNRVAPRSGRGLERGQALQG